MSVGSAGPEVEVDGDEEVEVEVEVDGDEAEDEAKDGGLVSDIIANRASEKNEQM